MPEVKMQAEQQPRHTDETDEEFNEWNQQYNQSQNEESGNENKPHDWQSLGETALDDFLTTNQESPQEKSYEEARRDGSLPEGVRDARDYQEYQAQERAYAKEQELKYDKIREKIEQKRNEKIKESYDFLKSSYPGAYTDDIIDALLYESDFRTEKDENGKEKYKINEKGEIETFINKDKLKQSFEYMFDNGISLKDLSDGQIIDISVDSPDYINAFVESYYFISDRGHFPKFNQQYKPMHSLHNIIESRKNHEELSEESRDFAYACYPDGAINDDDAVNYPYEDNDIAERLLFGGSPNRKVTIIPGLLAETKRVCTQDSTEKYLDRIGHLSDKSIDIDIDLPYLYIEDSTLQLYHESQSYIKESIWKNMHNIFSYIEDNDNGYYSPDMPPEEWEFIPTDWREPKSYAQMMGTALLKYIECGYGVPLQGYKETDLNPTGIGLGEAIMMTGISPNTILDTYFGGEKGIDANYAPAYAHLEARHIGELLEMGIPKECIIDNIRKKNERDDLHGVSIQEKEIKSMREAGISNPEILDAMAEDPQVVARDPFGTYHRKGFTDADIIKYLAMKLERADQQQEI